MLIKELRELIMDYDDDAEFIVAVNDDRETFTFDEFGQDGGYEEEALCLTISFPEGYYYEIEKDLGVKKYFYSGMIVKPNIEALEENGAGDLDMDYNDTYIVAHSFDSNGEEQCNVRSVKTGHRVFVREDIEYNFVEEEMDKVDE